MEWIWLEFSYKGVLRWYDLQFDEKKNRSSYITILVICSWSIWNWHWSLVQQIPPHTDLCFTEFIYFSIWLKYMNSVKHIKRPTTTVSLRIILAFHESRVYFRIWGHTRRIFRIIVLKRMHMTLQWMKSWMAHCSRFRINQLIFWLVSFYRNKFFTNASNQRRFFIAQFDIHYDSWLTNLFRQKVPFLKQADFLYNHANEEASRTVMECKHG